MANNLGFIEYKDNEALLNIIKKHDQNMVDYYNTDEFWLDAEKEHDETDNSSIEVRPFGGLDYITVNF